MRRTLSILALIILAAWSAAAWAQSDGSLLLLMSGGKPWFTFRVPATAGLTITPVITLVAGAPTPTWIWGDGTSSTGTSMSHTYAAAGTYTVQVKGIAPSQLATVDFTGDPTVMPLSVFSACSALTNIAIVSSAATVITGTLASMPAGMAVLSLYNTSSTITGTLASIPAGMQYMDLSSTSSTITGTLASMPAGMVVLHLGSTTSAITGTLASMPAGMAVLHLGSTSSTITGGAGAPLAVGISWIDISATSMLTAAVDEVVGYLYTYRTSWTTAAPVLGIGGSNQAPSGIYQSATPPTSGKETIYDLTQDPTSEGFKRWSITYTP